MSITVINYLDQALVEQVNAQATEQAEAAKAAAEAASISAGNDFSSVLNEATQSYSTTNNTVSATNCPEELLSIFEEAASTFGVSVNLLTSIARAESNFNASAVSSAGAVGIMQLMPATAASLGVSNSYDARENIMGGAKLISQLLSKYNGNTSLALAAYNAGSGNVDKYGGIPPFTETQNYVQKVLAYMNTASQTDARDELKQTLSNFAASHNINKDTLGLLAAMLKAVKPYTSSSTSTAVTAAETAAAPSITVTVVDNSQIVNNYITNTDASSDPTDDTLASADNPAAADSSSGSGAVSDTSVSGSETVIDSSVSGSETVTDSSVSGNETVSDTSVSGNETVTDSSVSGNEPVIDSSVSGNETVTDSSVSENNTIGSSDTEGSGTIAAPDVTVQATEDVSISPDDAAANVSAADTTDNSTDTSVPADTIQ